MRQGPTHRELTCDSSTYADTYADTYSDVCDRDPRIESSHVTPVRMLTRMLTRRYADVCYRDPRIESSHVTLVLRFLHLLCEGHNLNLQNFLRHQVA
jgi:hypothetical protein